MSLKVRYVLCSLVISMTMFFLGCASLSTEAPQVKRPCFVDILAVAPFQIAIPTEEKQGVIDPITAEIHRGEVVTENGSTYMTRRFPEIIDAHFGCDLINPQQLAGYLPQKPKNPGHEVREVLSRAAKDSGAQAILAGTVFRYRERKGGEFGIEKAASVYFGLYLIDVKTSKIIWSGFFDETQTSLSENLFTAGKFLKRGGRWLTAAELAEYGLNETLKRLPGTLPEEKQWK